MQTRDKVLNYLITSKFVIAYVKKLMFPSDVDNLYEDYVQEVWLQLCEVNENKWKELMNNNDNTKHDIYYTVRNWVSMLIRNTVRSTTSAAYRRLKKQSTISDNLTDDEWHYLANVVEDTSLKLY